MAESARKAKHWRTGLGVGVFAIALLFMGWAMSQSPALLTEDAPFYAPDFTLSALDGQEITLSEQRGKWVLLNFWATWCGPCRQEMPILQMIAEDYPDVIVVGINQREGAEVIQPFVDALGITFPIALNPNDATLLNYQVIGLPQTFIINPDGEIVAREFGLFKPKTLFDALYPTG